MEYGSIVISTFNELEIALLKGEALESGLQRNLKIHLNKTPKEVAEEIISKYDGKFRQYLDGIIQGGSFTTLVNRI